MIKYECKDGTDHNQLGQNLTHTLHSGFDQFCHSLHPRDLNRQLDQCTDDNPFIFKLKLIKGKHPIRFMQG